MKITNEFTVNTPIDQAWAVLTDLEGIAPCLPGAQLTGVDGDVYTGKVKVKVGPVVSEFAGTAQFVEKDATTYQAVIDAKGKDSRSAANAAALITAHLKPAGNATLVTVDTDLKISGKLAQFGSGMIKEVSGKLLAQFVTHLEAKIAADTTTHPTPATAPTNGAAPEAAAVPAGGAGAAQPAAVVPSAAPTSPAGGAALGSAADAAVMPDVPATPAVTDAAADAARAAEVAAAKPTLTPEPAVAAQAAAPGTAAVTDPASLPEAGPIPNEFAHREVDADAARASAVAGTGSTLTPEPAVAAQAAAPGTAAITDPSSLPEAGPIPDEFAHREVAADAEYHASRTTPTPSPASPATTPAVATSTAPATAEPATTTAAAPSTDSVAVPVAGAAGAGAGTPEAGSSTHRTITSTAEPEALDLMSLAGSSIYKRLIPVVVAVVVVVVVVVWLVVR